MDVLYGCIILNENRRTINGGGLGTRLILTHVEVRSYRSRVLSYVIVNVCAIYVALSSY